MRSGGQSLRAALKIKVSRPSNHHPSNRTLSTDSNQDGKQPSNFWPSGPPSFHRDPAVTATSDQLYTSILRRYKELGRLDRREWGDPWAQREEWRWHPYFGPINVIKKAFPGFTWALGAFVVYCGYEEMTKAH